MENSSELSYRPLSDPKKRGMLVSIIEASFFNVWAIAVGGSYLTGMAIYLGAGGFALGVLAGLPAFATMLQLVSAPFVSGVVKRRRFLANWSGLQRFSGAFAGLIALALYPSKWALVIFVVLHLIAWAFMGPSTVVWQGYMTDLVPPQVRGRYFAQRSAFSGIISMGVVLLYGAMLDRYPGEQGFHLLYIFALIGALLNYISWFGLPELPPGEVRSNRPFLEAVRIPLLKAGAHRPAALFFAAWAFAQSMAAPFYPVVLVQKLGISFSVVSVLATVQTLTAILTASFWGRYQDKVGQTKAIGILSALLAAVPLLFLSARWLGLPVLVAAHMLQGTAANGMGLANQTLIMRLAPTEDRGSYFAFFAAAGGLTGFFTPLLMGPLTDTYMNGLLIASAAVSGLLALAWQRKVGGLVA